MKRLLALIFLLALLLPRFAAAQDTLLTSAARGTIALVSTPSGAEVFIDNTLLGTTPIKEAVVDTGARLLSLYYPTRRTWNAAIFMDTIHVQAGANAERHYAFPAEQLQSARLWMMSGDQADTIPKELSREGFQAILARLPSSEKKGNGSSPLIFPKDRFRRWSVFGALGTGVVSGVLAAHWKVQSNDAAEAFRLSKAPQDQEAMHRFDVRSGVAFAITQLSFGVLAYLLLSAE